MVVPAHLGAQHRVQNCSPLLESIFVGQGFIIGLDTWDKEEVHINRMGHTGTPKHKHANTQKQIPETNAEKHGEHKNNTNAPKHKHTDT